MAAKATYSGSSIALKMSLDELLFFAILASAAYALFFRG